MSDDVTFERVAPVIPVCNLEAALDRYGVLGFTVRVYNPEVGYGFADRGSVSLHVNEWKEHDPKRTASVVYIYVSDADAVYAEWSGSGIEGHFHEPFDTEYGLREFVFIDVDGTCHRVGSPLKRNAADGCDGR